MMLYLIDGHNNSAYLNTVTLMDDAVIIDRMFQNQNITAFSTNISTINAMSQVYNVAVSCSRVTGTTDVNAGLTVE